MDINIFLLVLILSLGFLIRLPFLDFPIDEDYGFYTYLAHFRSRGVKFIKDFWGGFPPTPFYLYIFAEKIFKNSIQNIRHFSNIYNFFILLSTFAVTNYLFNSSTALIAISIYALFSATPYLGTYSCHTEGFNLLPITLGVLAFGFGIGNNEPVYFLLAGAFISGSFLLKIVNIIYWVSFSFFLFINHYYEAVFYFSLSFFSCISIYLFIQTWVYYKKNRQFWLQHRIRIKTSIGFIHTSSKNDYKNDFSPIWKETSSILLISSFFFIYLFLAERTISENIIVVWTISTILILISQRVFRMYHYIPLIQLCSILSGLAIIKLIATLNTHPFLVIPALLFFMLFFLVNIYRKIYFYILYKKDISLLYFQKADQFFYVPAIANHIRENTSTNDCIYIWGPFVQLYRLSDRMSCEGFVFHFTKPYNYCYVHLFDELIKGISAKKPVYIVLIRPDLDMDVLSQITGVKYALERVFFNRYRVYRLQKSSKKFLQVSDMSNKEKLKWLDILTQGSMDYKIDETYIRKGMYKKAEVEYKEALKLHPNDFAVKFGLASLYRILHRHEEALKIYTEISKTSKNKEWIHLEKGLTYIELNRFDEALKNIQAEEKLWPKKAETRHALGKAYKQQNKYEEAISEFIKAIELDQTIEWCHLDLGLTYGMLGEYKKALEEINIEDKKHPGKAETKHGMGLMFLELGDIDNAIPELNRALEINPNNIFAQYNLCSIYDRKGDKGKAVNGYKKIIENNLSNPSIRGGSYFHLGKIYFKENDTNKATYFLKNCLEFIPNHSESSRYLTLLESKKLSGTPIS